MKESKFIKNGDLQINCIITNYDEQQIPLIIIPGLVDSAEYMEKDLSNQIIGYHIIISLRGRGFSSIPETGYTLEEQSSDIIAVIKELGLYEYYIFGYSGGVSYAIKAASIYPERVKGIILGDYSPYHPSFDKSWASRTMQSNPKISDKLINGLLNEGKFVSLVPELKQLSSKILLIKGEKSDSCFPQEALPNFRNAFPTAQIEILPGKGHNIFKRDASHLFHIINKFTEKIK